MSDLNIPFFDITLEQLQTLMKCHGPERIERVNELGGGEGICTKLKSSENYGLDELLDDLELRRKTFGANVIPIKKPKSFLRLMWEAHLNAILIILDIAAVVTIGLNLYSKSLLDDDNESEDHGWVEGVVILFSVAVVVFVTAMNDYMKERQFLNLKKQIKIDHSFLVIRNGLIKMITVSDIVVGEICELKSGDLVPADGILIQSIDLQIDESLLTGESDYVKKSKLLDPMIYSGTHVMQGSGKMVVTAVGIHSQAGIIYTLLNSVPPNVKNKNERSIGNYNKEKTVESKVVNAATDVGEQSSSEVITNSRDEQVNEAKNLQFESNNIRKQRKSILQNKLTKLSIVIGTVGAIIAAITFIILVVQFCIKKFVVDKLEWVSSDMNQIVHFFIVGVTLLVVVIPEGLPLAVTISLAYSVKKMMKDNNLVRHLDACETMGNATTICSDKTGTLTTNKMTVVASHICGNFFTTVPEFSSIPENVGDLIIKAISINTCYTSRVVPSPLTGKHGTQIGNKTDCALLGFVTALGKNYQKIREQYPEEIFAHVYPFNSIRKSMSTIVPVSEEKGYHLFIKGASEVLLKKCSYCYGKNGEIITFTNEMQNEFESSVIKPMARDGLRTILLAHRDFVYNKESINQEQISPQLDWKNEQDICDNLTLLCVVGIEDPVRPEVPAVMKKCQRAGIIVRMITGDNIITATSIALKCGIINYGGKYYVLESNEFNKRIRDSDGKIQQDLLDKVWPNLRVLARSTPTDKYVLVKGIMNSKIKVDREVVAVTGDGTNDAPALMEADVGFAMGITGTDVAKDASDIIITDDSFISIVKAIMWGRNIYDNIAKFLQFQLTVNVVAVIVTFTGACTIKDSPLRAVQMLWVNLIMDTLASLALATEAPTAKLLLRKPYGSSKFLISRTMFKNIIAQSIYQISVELFLLYYGDIMMDIPSGTNFKTSPTQHHTIIFNAFVMMTLFNEINSRSVNDQHNVFEGLFKNYIFCTIWIVSFVFQTLFIEFGQSIFWTSSLTLDQWLWCIFFGIGSLLWCQLSSCIRVNRVPRFLIWGKEDLITGEDARTSILWARGKSRLQYQLDVIQAFRESVDTNLV